MQLNQRSALNVPRTLIYMLCHQSSAPVSMMLDGVERKPALWTRMSIFRNVMLNFLKVEVRGVAERMSATAYSTSVLGQSTEMEDALESRFDSRWVMSPIANAPILAKESVVWRPVPVPPPVMLGTVLVEVTQREGWDALSMIDLSRGLRAWRAGRTDTTTLPMTDSSE